MVWMVREGSDRDANLAGRERRRQLRRWFRSRARDFSWRRDPQPWPVLVAEMLLRRTRAAQVEQHLPRILARFPDAAALAAAPLDEVEAELYSLGLRWRARDLSVASNQIVERHGGQVPLKVEELLELQGVGPYVASAVAATLTRRRVVLTDTNTVRVACRVAGIDRAGDIRRSRDVQEAITGLLDGPATVRDWWALLDLAAAICTPARPCCAECPFRSLCVGGDRTSAET
jgi:A/G-specific adenine glycosylase